MTVRVDVEPELLAWAVERSRIDPEAVHRRFAMLDRWLSGDRSPTFRQLEDFARATYTPMGFLLLREPPAEPLPVPDFRTIRNEHLGRPSADLLDTIHLCEQRQDWYRDHLATEQLEPPPFVGSLPVGLDPLSAAARIQGRLGYELTARGALGSWSDALRALTERAEELGVLVMISAIVASNTRRRLNPDEFRGFTLVDELAPVVFVNGADSKAAQIFTLAHELAHVWLGESALSDARPDRVAEVAVERWCNAVAAEILVPEAELRSHFDPTVPCLDQVQSLARVFRVSTLVVLRRALDAGLVDREEHATALAAERERIATIEPRRASSGNFLNTQPVRASKRFTRAVIASTVEGRTPYRDAFRLLGFKKVSTFESLRDRLGVA